MRALLIDNYDSFTYNLSQLWGMVSGQSPTVVANDDWESWKSLDLSTFDAVLISPGPGRPDREADFGISGAALAGPLPLLGVCLGHQGLCVAEGGVLAHAAEPMHGRTSPISHHGTGLFAGLPSPFQAARYHSLIITQVPASLQITATTPGPHQEELVMAVAHRTRCQWGVQFHPESIATEHGARLLANFAELAAADRQLALHGTSTHGRSHGETADRPACEPSAAATQGGSGGTHSGLRLLTRQLDLEADCPRVYAQIFAVRDHTYWLDGATAPAGARVSILGGLGPLGERVTARAGRGQVSVTGPGQEPRLAEGDIFSYLGDELARRSIEPTGLPFDFALGYVGYLGYELKADCGGDRAHDSDLPDAALLFSDQAVVVDHDAAQTWVLTLATGATEPDAAAWLASTADAITAGSHPAAAPRPAPDSGPAEPDVDLDVSYRHSPAQYQQLVRACLDQIRDGESYEICLTNTVTATVTVDPLRAFLELRAVSPAPHAALLCWPQASVASASPERFLRIWASGRIQAKPIKGTRRRGTTPPDDAELAHDLATSVKDRSENLMIVDLLRNDLGSVAAPGSVQVTRLFDVETFATVHQLVSTVEAQLATGRSAVDCVRAAFPGGSMTGAPKRRTMQIIDRLEGGPRGVYSGALGYFSLSGAVDLSIVIRTLVIHPGRVTLGTGGAVVALSDPQAEVDEMLLKAEGPLRALSRAVSR